MSKTAASAAAFRSHELRNSPGISAHAAPRPLDCIARRCAIAQAARRRGTPGRDIMKPRILLALVAAPALAFTLAAPAFAADEEIQVYMDEIGALRKLSLDVHINNAVIGRRIATFPDEQASDGRTRITPEFGYALSDSWELGAYLPLANVDDTGELSVDGVKLRLKYIAPHQEQGLFWGANLEIGYVNDT